MRYNFACGLVADLHGYAAALDLLETILPTMRADTVSWAKSDPDLDPIRDHPRVQSMLAAAKRD